MVRSSTIDHGWFYSAKKDFINETIVDSSEEWQQRKKREEDTDPQRNKMTLERAAERLRKETCQNANGSNSL